MKKIYLPKPFIFASFKEVLFFHTQFFHRKQFFFCLVKEILHEIHKNCQAMSDGFSRVFHTKKNLQI